MNNLATFMIPSHTYISDRDPNAQKNRIPTDAELALLKSLKNSHNCLIENIKEQMKSAQATYDAILARYEQQFRELEGTQSQLHESKKALQLMQDQCSMLQVESHRLSGLTHPIRRYPSDVLQFIFESTSDIARNSKKIRTALILSHVCQRWRAIAQDSPRLWSHIEYMIKRNTPIISSFWNYIIPKVKAVPVTIVIRNLDGDVQSRLQACNLTQIFEVQKVEIHLTSHRLFDDLLPLEEILPTGRVQSLEIFSQMDDGAQDLASEPIWDIGKLIQEWPKAPMVSLVATCIFRITPSDKLDTVTTLELNSMQGVDVLRVVSLLGQLQVLKLFRVDIILPPTTANQTIAASLKRLVINTDDEGEPWLPLLSCPSLTAFHHAGPAFSEICIAFVAMHVSILELDYFSEDNLVPIIASIAPQLRSLCVEPTNIPNLHKWKTDGAPIPPFPSLRELKISVVNSKMSATDFDAIVHTYCVPDKYTSREPIHQSIQLTSLAIITDGSDEDAEIDSWHTSKLYQQARKIVSADEVWDGCENTQLSWVN